MDMLIFALIMPMVVTVILGIIYGNKPAYDGASYTFLAQSFGAVSSIAICAGGVMGLPLVVSDYRHKKILKRLKVTPVAPSVILAVQVSIYALYAFASLILVYLTASLFFGFRLEGSWSLFLIGYLLVMAAMFSIGMMVGGIAPNPKIAGVIASLLYFPMLIFSGATLPYEVMPRTLQSTADVMPLTQGIKLLKAATLGQPVRDSVISIAILAALTAACACVSVRFFRWE
jgi:ABC-2 type transport system permease protein